MNAIDQRVVLGFTLKRLAAFELAQAKEVTAGVERALTALVEHKQHSYSRRLIGRQYDHQYERHACYGGPWYVPR